MKYLTMMIVVAVLGCTTIVHPTQRANDAGQNFAEVVDWLTLAREQGWLNDTEQVQVNNLVHAGKIQVDQLHDTSARIEALEVRQRAGEDVTPQLKTANDEWLSTRRELQTVLDVLIQWQSKIKTREVNNGPGADSGSRVDDGNRLAISSRPGLTNVNRRTAGYTRGDGASEGYRTACCGPQRRRDAA